MGSPNDGMPPAPIIGKPLHRIAGADPFVKIWSVCFVCTGWSFNKSTRVQFARQQPLTLILPSKDGQVVGLIVCLRGASMKVRCLLGLSAGVANSANTVSEDQCVGLHSDCD